MDTQFEQFQSCFDKSSIPFAIIKPILNHQEEAIDLLFCYLNEAWAELVNFPVSRLINKPMSAVFTETDKKLYSIYSKVAFDGDTQTVEEYSLMLKKHLRIFCYQASYGYCACVFTDITGEQTREKTDAQPWEQPENLINTVPGGIVIYRVGQTFETLYFNDGVCELSGHSRSEYAEWIREDAMVAVFAEDRPRVIAEIEAAIKENRIVNISYRIYHKTGSPVWIHLSAKRIMDNGDNSIYCAVFVDISQDRHTLDLLLVRTEHDELTGLYNRSGLKHILSDFFSSCSQAPAVFIMLDIDNFKAVNDTYGHTKGDEVLCTIANALQRSGMPNDVVARLGGDEFAMFWPYLDGVAEFTQRLQSLCDISKIKIEDEFPLNVTCSIGVCIAPQYGSDFDTLYNNADKALFTTKRTEKGGYTLYNHNMENCAPILAQNMEWLLDEGADAIYICNADTYELLYLNLVARTLYTVNEPYPLGRPCYQVLMHLDKPCSFCKMDKMCKESFLEREFSLKNTDLSLNLKGKLMDWHGINAHIEFIQRKTKTE